MISPLQDLEKESPKKYKMLFILAFHWVQEQVKTEKGRKIVNKQGLEGAIESTLALISKNYFKVIINDEGIDAYCNDKVNKFKRLVKKGYVQLVSGV